MAIFTYSATDRGGKVIKSEREAESEKILAHALKAEGFYLIEAKEKGKGGWARVEAKANEWAAKLRPIGLVDKMFFTRNLAVMISAGLSLTRALDALSKEIAHPGFGKIISEVNRSVIKGQTFAEALKLHQKVFGDLYINMVEVGETTGKLALVLKLLARQMKKDYDLRKNIVGAMIYPLIIITILIIIGSLMMIYVVPTLTSTIKELGAELPWTTKLIIGVSDFMSNYLLWLGLGMVAFAAAFWRFLKTNRGKFLFDHVVLKLPVFGVIVKKFNTARFCRTLAYLISSGVPIVRSLEITSAVLGNSSFKIAAQDAAIQVQKGTQLHIIFGAYPKIFDQVTIQMLEVGEETGKISGMLLRLALFFEEEVTATTKNLSAIIEPLLMVVVGAAVGFFAISMLQPIYSSLGSI